MTWHREFDEPRCLPAANSSRCSMPARACPDRLGTKARPMLLNPRSVALEFQSCVGPIGRPRSCITITIASLRFGLFHAKRELTQMDKTGAGQVLFTGDSLLRKLDKSPCQCSASDILTDRFSPRAVVAIPSPIECSGERPANVLVVICHRAMLFAKRQGRQRDSKQRWPAHHEFLPAPVPAGFCFFQASLCGTRHRRSRC
jgi:hypothetical protein